MSVQALVIDLDVVSTNQWLGAVVSLTVICAFAWGLASRVFKCFDGLQNSITEVSRKVEALQSHIDQEALIQHHRHETNVEKVTSLTAVVGKLDVEVDDLRMRVAGNSAQLRGLNKEKEKRDG